MDARTRDPQGRTACPNCGKVYVPDLGERPADGRLIQEQFPEATAIQREQLMTGLCSDKCWNAYLGGDDEIAEHDSEVYSPGHPEED